MKQITGRWLVLALVVAACSDHDSPQPVDELDPMRVPVQQVDETGKLTTILGRIELPNAGADPVDEVVLFLERHAAAMRLHPDLDDLVLERATHDIGGSTYMWRQQRDGVPVFDSGIVVGLDPKQTIVLVQNDYNADVAVPTKATIGQVQAVAAANAALGIHVTAHAEAPMLVIAQGDKRAPGLHLAYLMSIETRKPRGDFRVFVDATTGEVVRVLDMLKHAGAPCVPCNPATDTACGRVFHNNAVETLNNTALTDTSNVDAAMTGCLLANLTSTTNLNGTYVNTSITAAPRVGPPYNYLRSVNQNGADEVNAYYHVNRAKTRLNAIGFPNVMNYSINTDAHDPTLGDNAHYVPSTKIIEFGVGGVDDAQDADVIYHEYGHAIQDNQVPGYGITIEGASAGEGFGDFWSAAITDDSAATVLGTSCLAAYDAVFYNPYTGAPGSGCLRRVDGVKQYPKDQDFEVHDDGEMWSAALWRLRNSLGGAIVDPLVIKSHTFVASNTNFINLVNGLLSADNTLNGGANNAAILNAMKLQGMPHSGTAATWSGTPNTVNYSCQTAHNYANYAYVECKYTQPGAAKLRFHFTSFNTETGYDFAYVSDASFGQVQALSGTPFGTGAGYSAAVTGDTIVVRFKADYTVVKAGFTIDQVQYVNGGCASDAQCNDGNACNGSETCNIGTGQCLAGTAPVCSDGNACTADLCVPAIGCTYQPVANGTACSDGDICNGGETCQAGACSAGTPLNCDDGNTCTSDSCNSDGCQHAPVVNGSTCDDGNACTNADACTFGACFGLPMICDDLNGCTADACNPAIGCVFVTAADGTSCSDGDGCNGAESCQGGSCTSGSPVTCADDGNPCTIETCTANGCNSVAGNDGAACTPNGQCGPGICSAGSCAALDSGASCDDGNPCTVDSCNVDGACTHTAINDGTACGDGNACNGGETCQAGACTAGAAPSCDDGNPCTANACDPVLGCVAIPVADGTSCADGSVCNGTETCQAGTCSAGSAPNCDDGNPCTVDGCGANGCTHDAASDGTSCSDGNACSNGDTCQAGSCTAGAPLACDDGNICSTDSCNTATGCVHTTVCTAQTFSTETWESNNWTGGTGWTAGWTHTGDSAIRNVDGPHGGVRHVRLRTSTGVITRTVNLVGANSVHLKFWSKATGWESTDRANILVSTNGGSFTVVKTIVPAEADNTWRFYDLDLSGVATSSSFQVSFRSAMNQTNDWWFIDDISVSGNR